MTSAGSMKWGARKERALDESEAAVPTVARSPGPLQCVESSLAFVMR